MLSEVKFHCLCQYWGNVSHTESIVGGCIAIPYLATIRQLTSYNEWRALNLSWSQSHEPDTLRCHNSLAGCHNIAKPWMFLPFEEWTCTILFSCHSLQCPQPIYPQWWSISNIIFCFNQSLGSYASWRDCFWRYIQGGEGANAKRFEKYWNAIAWSVASLSHAGFGRRHLASDAWVIPEGFFIDQGDNK